MPVLHHYEVLRLVEVLSARSARGDGGLEGCGGIVRRQVEMPPVLCVLLVGTHHEVERTTGDAQLPTAGLRTSPATEPPTLRATENAPSRVAVRLAEKHATRAAVLNVAASLVLSAGAAATGYTAVLAL
jgi:hypothetical protein